MRADIALWDLGSAAHAGIADPVAAMVLGPPRPVAWLLVDGRPVVESGELRTADLEEVARAAAATALLPA